MALIECSECGHQVSDKANTCPQCGAPVGAEEGSEVQSEQAQGKNKVTGIIALLVLIGVVYVCSSSGDGGGAEAEHSELAAWVMCQQFVEDKLKSPKSADFPWGYSDYTTHLGNGKYRINAYVGAQNTFGADARTQFQCVVQYADDEKWRLESLTFGE